MCELVSGANTVDSDEVCAVVFREIGVCESATSATSAKVRTEGGSANGGEGKGESATSAKVRKCEERQGQGRKCAERQERVRARAKAKVSAACDRKCVGWRSYSP